MHCHPIQLLAFATQLSNTNVSLCADIMFSGCLRDWVHVVTNGQDLAQALLDNRCMHMAASYS